MERSINKEKNALSRERINNIINKSRERYHGKIIENNVEQALTIMLSITHFFKFKVDNQTEWYEKHKERMEMELEQFKLQQGIKTWKDEMNWIRENGALQYHICIQDLLLQTLFSINGLYYRINDRDYDWEEEFDEIFVNMPYGKEFDHAMIYFLLLPLYNSTHNTNYRIESDD